MSQITDCFVVPPRKDTFFLTKISGKNKRGPSNTEGPLLFILIFSIYSKKNILFILIKNEPIYHPKYSNQKWVDFANVDAYYPKYYSHPRTHQYSP
jgi:hypothetical protein